MSEFPKLKTTVHAVLHILYPSAAFICLCRVFSCVHPKCYQLQPHFMNGFWVLLFFLSRPKFLCFRNFICSSQSFSNFCSRKRNYFIRMYSVHELREKTHTHTPKPHNYQINGINYGIFLIHSFSSASLSFLLSVCWQLTVVVAFIFFGVSVWRQQIVCWQPIGFKLHN